MKSALVATWIPLLVGTIAIGLTIVIHAAALIANLHLVRRERRLGRAGVVFWIDLRIVARAVMLALAAHLIAIGRRHRGLIFLRALASIARFLPSSTANRTHGPLFPSLTVARRMLPHTLGSSERSVW